MRRTYQRRSLTPRGLNGGTFLTSTIRKVSTCKKTLHEGLGLSQNGISPSVTKNIGSWEDPTSWSKHGTCCGIVEHENRCSCCQRKRFIGLMKKRKVMKKARQTLGKFHYLVVITQTINLKLK